MVLTRTNHPKPLSQRRSRWPIFAGLAPLAACVLAVMVPQWLNDTKLAGLEERASMVALPPGTERDIDLAVQSAVGLLSGNSNHCDYLVRLPLLTKLSDAELTRHFESTPVEGVEGGALTGTVYVNPGGSWRDGYRGVIVQFFDAYHDPGFDLRCH